MENTHLALNSKKCSIRFEWIQLLGHIVDKFEIYILEAKSAAIRNMSFPTTLAELKYFLGLTEFYQQFIPFYALQAGPLHRLTAAVTQNIRKANQKQAVKAETVKAPQPIKKQIESF